MVHLCLKAGEVLDREGIAIELIDPRTVAPLDTETILASVRKTGRLVTAQEATAPCSVGAELIALAAEHCLSSLKAPPIRVAAPFINVPTPVPLAEARAPKATDVANAVRTVMESAA
jgi:pyruvate dehydrogenase E1 component beta subunit